MTERKKHIGFMDLPGEIRNTIYSFAIPNGHKINADGYVIKDGLFIRNEPGILRTNKQIRNECLPLFYGGMNCFEYNTQRFSKLRLFARSQAASYLQHISIDFIVTSNRCLLRSPPIECYINAHLHDSYLTFEFFDRVHGPMKCTTSLVLLKHKVFIDMENWAMANFKTKTKLTGYDLFAAIDRIGNIPVEKVEYIEIGDRRLGYAWLSSEGWERHPRYEPGVSSRCCGIWIMDQKLGVLRERCRRVHATQ